MCRRRRPRALKNQRYWTPRNDFLLPPFFTDAAILNVGSDTGELLKIFARSITERAEEGEDAEGDDDNENKSECGVEAEDKNTTKTGKTNQSTANTLATIADNCNGVLTLLQAVAVKSPRVTAAPLSLRVEKRARVWFCCWTDTKLRTPPKPAPQYHLGLTGVLNDVSTRLKTAEALRPVVSDQTEEEKETKGWYHIPPTAQRVILAAIATNGTYILTLPPPTIHRFLISRNVTALQVNCALTYAGNNLYITTSFC